MTPKPAPKPSDAAPPLTLAEFAPQAIVGLILSGRVEAVDGRNPYGISLSLANRVYSMWRTYLSLAECPADIVLDEDRVETWLLETSNAQVTAREAKNALKAAANLRRDQEAEAVARRAQSEALLRAVEDTRVAR